MELYLDHFMNFLAVERGLAQNTLDAYGRDLARYLGFLERQGVKAADGISPAMVLRFIADLKETGLGARSRARALVALRTFHKFLVAEKLATTNPTALVLAPKSIAPLPSTLSPRDVEALLASPQGQGLLDGRDRAMLEILYATGLRVSELVGLRLIDLQLDVGYLTAFGKRSKQRIVPLGETAVAALRSYLGGARPCLDKTGGSPVVFLKRSGAGL
ncbi:MAG: site-specific tyrosine recombinase XerD, partial [Desulfuromonas sp.]